MNGIKKPITDLVGISGQAAITDPVIDRSLFYIVIEPQSDGMQGRDRVLTGDRIKRYLFGTEGFEVNQFNDNDQLYMVQYGTRTKGHTTLGEVKKHIRGPLEANTLPTDRWSLSMGKRETEPSPTDNDPGEPISISYGKFKQDLLGPISHNGVDVFIANSIFIGRNVDVGGNLVVRGTSEHYGLEKFHSIQVGWRNNSFNDLFSVTNEGVLTIRNNVAPVSSVKLGAQEMLMQSTNTGSSTITLEDSDNVNNRTSITLHIGSGTENRSGIFELKRINSSTTRYAKLSTNSETFGYNGVTTNGYGLEFHATYPYPSVGTNEAIRYGWDGISVKLDQGTPGRQTTLTREDIYNLKSLRSDISNEMKIFTGSGLELFGREEGLGRNDFYNEYLARRTLYGLRVSGYEYDYVGKDVTPHGRSGIELPDYDFPYGRSVFDILEYIAQNVSKEKGRFILQTKPSDVQSVTYISNDTDYGNSFYITRDETGLIRRVRFPFPSDGDVELYPTNNLGFYFKGDVNENGPIPYPITQEILDRSWNIFAVRTCFYRVNDGSTLYANDLFQNNSNIRNHGKGYGVWIRDTKTDTEICTIVNGNYSLMQTYSTQRWVDEDIVLIKYINNDNRARLKIAPYGLQIMKYDPYDSLAKFSSISIGHNDNLLFSKYDGTNERFFEWRQIDNRVVESGNTLKTDLKDFTGTILQLNWCCVSKDYYQNDSAHIAIQRIYYYQYTNSSNTLIWEISSDRPSSNKTINGSQVTPSEWLTIEPGVPFNLPQHYVCSAGVPFSGAIWRLRDYSKDRFDSVSSIDAKVLLKIDSYNGTYIKDNLKVTGDIQTDERGLRITSDSVSLYGGGAYGNSLTLSSGSVTGALSNNDWGLSCGKIVSQRHDYDIINDESLILNSHIHNTNGSIRSGLPIDVTNFDTDGFFWNNSIRGLTNSQFRNIINYSVAASIVNNNVYIHNGGLYLCQRDGASAPSSNNSDWIMIYRLRTPPVNVNVWTSTSSASRYTYWFHDNKIWYYWGERSTSTTPGLNVSGWVIYSEPTHINMLPDCVSPFAEFCNPSIISTSTVASDRLNAIEIALAKNVVWRFVTLCASYPIIEHKNILDNVWERVNS